MLCAFEINGDQKFFFLVSDNPPLSPKYICLVRLAMDKQELGPPGRLLLKSSSFPVQMELPQHRYPMLHCLCLLLLAIFCFLD